MADETTTLPATRDPGEVRTAPLGMRGGERVMELPEGGDPYGGIATLSLTEAQRARLTDEIPAGLFDVLPTGEVYLPQIHYRDLLNEVIGPGAWGLRPLGGWLRQGNLLCREWALYVQGRYVSEAIGSAEYNDRNPRQNWSDAAETAKSNALMRCCKDLGIASQAWNKRWAQGFQAEHCVRVWVNEGDEHQPKWKPLWRRKDAAAFARGGRVIEKGVVEEKKAPIARPVRTDEPEPVLDEPPDDQAPLFDDTPPSKPAARGSEPAPKYVTPEKMRAIFGALRDNRPGQDVEELLRTKLRNQYGVEHLDQVPAIMGEAILEWAQRPVKTHARLVCRPRPGRSRR